MTVRELIALLRTMPADAPVSVTVGGIPHAPLIGAVDAVVCDYDAVFVSASVVV